jgi:hypothetical protein
MYYHDNKQQEGIRNKLDAHVEPYSKPTSKRIVAADDPEYRELLQNQFSEMCEKSRKDAEDTLVETKFKVFKNKVTSRSKSAILLSQERYRYVQAVYSCVDPEFSSILLCSENPPTGSLYETIFLRFLTSDGDGMEKLKDDFAQIAAYALANYKCRKGEEVKYLCGAYARSMMALNSNRLRGAQREHVILGQYKTLTTRCENEDAKMENMRAKEKAQEIYDDDEEDDEVQDDEVQDDEVQQNQANVDDQGQVVSK